MFRKTVIIISMVVIFSTSLVWASDADYYITVGRQLMFDGTLSGLRLAYETFDNGLKDLACPDCNTNRELKFWHAVTGTTMLVFRDDNDSIDSVFELARQFDIEVLGNCWAPYLEPLGLDFDPALNQYDAYEIPAGAPDANEVRNIIDTSMIPEIEAIIADLNSISDEPDDRFQIYLESDEIRIFFHPNSPVINPGSPGYDPDSRFLQPLEVDYGEVLLLKGILMALKAQLEAQAAYDMYVDANDMLIEKIYGDSFNMNADLLDPHPDFLKVLPTVNDSNDGAEILAHARRDWIDAVNYYLDAVEYISSEDDPQDDEFLYIDPNDKKVSDAINERLTTLRDSLVNDTAETYTIETTKRYDIQCSGSFSIGQLELAFDLVGLEGGGRLTLEQCAGVPSRWAFEDFSIEGDELYIEMDFESSGINYMYAQSLDLANSVLFTPIECGPNPSTYKCALLDENLFSATGTAQGWQGYNQTWSYMLPFAFPYFGTTYTSVYVCTNGFLDFTDSGYYYGGWENKIRIEPFGASLRTDVEGGYDIYIEQVDSNEVKFRWDADNYGSQCNFSVSLFSNGNIRFDYGPGNEVSPYVGISNGSYDSYIPLGGLWGSGLLTGTISQDQNSITNAIFEYWSYKSGTLNGLSGQIINVEVQDVNFDFNPVFGSSTRYPDPVNPRDLLPVFDEWHAPQPNTVGHGLDNDATLGGILPDMTQYDWQVLYDLQPSGLFYLDFISPGQIQLDGVVNDWTADQIVFADISGDTEGDSNDVKGVDIKNVYMAYDSEYVYGAISLNDPIVDSRQYRSYTLTMSYSPENTSTLDSLMVEIYTSETYSYGNLYHMTYDAGGWVWWQHIADLDFAIGQNVVEFKVPFADIPSDLPGRFISIKSYGHQRLLWYQEAGEENDTHLRIGDVGTISGTINYSGYRGAPIFIQTYTDPENPENSIVASTMILEPGPYTLSGIGLGWQGYVTAFTPLFGFNIFDLEALTIETSVSVFMFNTKVDGVDIVLNNPPILEKDIWVPGEIDTMLDKEDWYAFDAVQGGTYTLDVNRLTSQYASMTLFGRDGHSDIEELYYWQAQQINWMCPVSGRYYVKVKDAYWQPEGGTYEIRMTSDLTCPDADIACADWVGVKDCKVDCYDLAVLVSHWLDSCSEPYWCDESDFDQSRSIDFADFALLANEWLQDGIP